MAEAELLFLPCLSRLTLAYPMLELRWMKTESLIHLLMGVVTEMTVMISEPVRGKGGRTHVTPEHFTDRRSRALGQECLPGAINQELQRCYF